MHDLDAAVAFGQSPEFNGCHDLESGSLDFTGTGFRSRDVSVVPAFCQIEHALLNGFAVRFA
jgi:hypothetical protein